MNNRLIRTLFFIVVFSAGSLFVGRSAKGQAPVGEDELSQWMIAQAKAWAEQSCGQPWVLSDLLAADFRGTSPGGSRYGKPREAPTFGPETQWHTDCQLLEADVRFFGPDVAVVYGAESSVAPVSDLGSERRCLVWTDTWLKRDGKWQIIAAQDTRVDCQSR